MPASRRLGTAPPPTLRQLAADAGVSQMTVSRALSGRGRIAEETRQRILLLARKLGYRPNPEIAKFMNLLRGRRPRRFQSVIVGITTRKSTDPEAYLRALATGAREQLTSRGYSFEVVHLAGAELTRGGVQRRLRSRGVEGILVLPQQVPVDLSTLLDWSQFAVVAASASATVPSEYRVTPHHFANALVLCRELTARGHQRIGLVIGDDHDRRTEHGYTGGVSWHGLNEAAVFVPPLVTACEDPASLRAWFARERPDVVVTSELSAARRCAALLGCRLHGSRPRFVLTSRMPLEPGGLSGVDEHPELIGRAAADLLAGLVERPNRDRRRSEMPRSLLLTGRWVE